MADLTDALGGEPVNIYNDVSGNQMVIQSDGSHLTSLGNTGGKTNVLKTGNLVTTTVTADQVILTYTVTSGKTFFLAYLLIEGDQTSPAGGTSVPIGVVSVETPSGTKVLSSRMIAGGGVLPQQTAFCFAEPIPISSATVIRVVVTPASTTSFTWYANFGGYER